MKKQCLIIGLGVFGMSVAKRLSEEKMEILAIDKNMNLVERASEFVTKAICMDVTNLESLKDLPLKDFEIAVVGIGEDVPASVLTCLALKEENVNYLIAKAGNRLHKKILTKLDVNEIVLPEEELGIVTAKKILNYKE